MYIDAPLFWGIIIIIAICIIATAGRLERLRREFDVNVGNLWDKVERLEKERLEKHHK